MIGLSLSLCIQDILEGRVEVNDVEKIISRTCARTDEDWQLLEDHYSKSYWRVAPEAGLALLAYFRIEGKLDQPRLRDDPVPFGMLAWAEDQETADKFLGPKEEEW